MNTAYFERQINRLKAKRENSPYYAAFRAQQASLAEKTKSVDQQLAGNLMRSGASVGASEQVAQNMMDRSRATTGELWNNFATKETQRKDTIDNRIETLTMAKEEKEAEEERARKAKKAGFMKVLSQVGGSLLGAGLTLAIPGAGAALGGGVMAALSGAGIGGGVGQAVGSFFGEDGGFGINDVDPEDLMAGIGDTISGISSTLTLKSQKSMMNEFSELMPTMQSMTGDELSIISGLLQTGQVEMAIEMLRKKTQSAVPGATETGSNDYNEWLKQNEAYWKQRGSTI